MDMMKNMYNDGDDKTKRTIAESWEKSQRGELSGGIGGMDNVKDMRK